MNKYKEYKQKVLNSIKNLGNDDLGDLLAEAEESDVKKAVLFDVFMYEMPLGDKGEN